MRRISLICFKGFRSPVSPAILVQVRNRATRPLLFYSLFTSDSSRPVYRLRTGVPAGRLAPEPALARKGFPPSHVCLAIHPGRMRPDRRIRFCLDVSETEATGPAVSRPPPPPQRPPPHPHPLQ